jgi:hypothetical protein
VDFLRLFGDQERQGFADLAGSEGAGALRVSEGLLNAVLAEQLQGSTAIKSLHVAPRAGNRFGVRLALVKPAFLPPISLEVIVEKQPELPGDPVMVLLLSGLGGLLRFAGPAAGFLKALPPGVRMEGERVFVDICAALAAKGLASVLNYVESVLVTTEEGRLVLAFSVRVNR